MTEYNIQMKPYPPGAHCEGDGIYFSFVSAKEVCGILLYDKISGRRLARIPFDSDHRVGSVYYKYIREYDASKITYQFYEEDKIVPDAHARIFVGKTGYGRERNEKDLKAGFLTELFDWQRDKRPRIPYEECICYCMHVRGFTRHTSSKVNNRGTFLGIIEKLPYLQEIGVTTVELQPAYEFMEIPTKEERMQSLPYPMKEGWEDIVPKRLNYWGYKRGYYYAPKAAYAAQEPASEFKKMVREFHKNGMEIVMQFYFPTDVPFAEIQEILRYWVVEYHVDGFHLMGENLPTDLLAKDPMLTDTKLWYYGFYTDTLYKRDEIPAYRNLASYQDDFMYTMRKFLKGDEGMVGAVMYQMRHIPQKTGRIHYLSNYYGMPLMDMVSYDRKHNEENGEENRDGSDYNCSWNCGEEGRSRRKKVNGLRLRQLKNAMCMLLLGQSTPLIFMGDEFGNSQKGNNNPYCQDNAVTWLDWGDVDRNAELHSFWKRLVEIRKKHPVLHQAREPRIMDYIACGYPDLSYHGMNAWRPQTDNYSRCLGILYCGKYVKTDHDNDDNFFYIAMNMHWEKHEFGLPKLPKGLKWQLLLSTDTTDTQKRDENQSDTGNTDSAAGITQSVENGAADSEEDKNTEIRCGVPLRSISVFCSVPDESTKDTGNGRRRRKKDAADEKKRMAAARYTDRTIF